MKRDKKRLKAKREYKQKLADWVWRSLQLQPEERGEIKTLPEMIRLLLDDKAWR